MSSFKNQGEVSNRHFRIKQWWRLRQRHGEHSCQRSGKSVTSAVCWWMFNNWFLEKRWGQGKDALIFSFCSFLWCKCFHDGWFPAINSLTSSLQIFWELNNQLLYDVQAGSSAPLIGDLDKNSVSEVVRLEDKLKDIQ